MTYLITLLISVAFWISIIWVQNIYDMGVIWRIIDLVVPLFIGCGFIYAGAMAPAEPRAVLLQIGAALLALVPISLAYIVYKNWRGW